MLPDLLNEPITVGDSRPAILGAVSKVSSGLCNY